MELDHAVYLLNFPHIVLGLTSSGEWGVYYRMPCRYLDLEEGLCTVHGTDDQPSICQHYNPYQCWYRRVLTVDTHDDFVLVDRRRLGWMLDRVAFDEERRIVEVPHWDEIVEAFALLPVAEDDPERSATNVHDTAWRAVLLSDTPPSQEPPLPDANPCGGCSAWCCTTLVFPTGTPTTASQIDYLRFALGFPGVELGVADGGWALVVRATCRHLEGGRCGVYGTDERPLLCSYYDAMKCTYRGQFGDPRPSDFVRVQLEHMGVLAGLFAFDQEGRAGALPTADLIRDVVGASAAPS
jgi:Fe-S-cluster containining protein